MRRLAVILSAAVLMVIPLVAQTPVPQVTASDYARAERFLAASLTGLVVGGTVPANWLPDDRFWYRRTLDDGAEFVLVDPSKATRGAAFDHAGVAAALSKATNSTYDARHLPFETFDFAPDQRSITVTVASSRWTCASDGKGCTAAGAPPAARIQPSAGRGGRGGRGSAGGPSSSDGKPLALSPDGRRGVFIRNWNLWVQDLATREERQLTTDGVQYFGYATDNAGWSSSDRAIVSWSPDSKRLATQQQDERNVGDMYLVNTTVGHPTLRVSKFPLPGDPVISMVHRVIVDVDRATVTRLQMPPDFHRATLGDDVSMRDYNWSPDGTRLALASVSRDHKKAWVSVADAASGTVRKVLEEQSPTQFESQAGWDVLWDTDELIWCSERDNWSQLYLYDLKTGGLKNRITSGDGPVMQIARVDPKSRMVWFGANGREPGQDPYFLHFYRTGLDGQDVASLTPDDGTHTVQISPSGRFLIDTSSKPDVPPSSTLRSADGRVVLPLEKADISKLLATGWQPPVSIKVKAHDGRTDLYGLMFRPTRFDPSKKYPVVNNVYPGPQTGSTGSRAFTPARGDRQALAELGFIVVTIDGMGTPGRSKAFQDSYYGAMGRDNTIPDQIAGMEDLAKTYPYIDLTRAGIWGHSGGGFATTTAMFRFPDFFKAGIAESGNHDQRENEDDWGERYQGLLVKNADGTDNYEAEANQNFAKNLKGHLMLAHGTMDTNVPPYQTMLVAEALIKANKDFDLILLPNQNHGYGSASAYMIRRRWDFFVRWLLGAEPPKEYQMK